MGYFANLAMFYVAYGRKCMRQKIRASVPSMNAFKALQAYRFGAHIQNILFINFAGFIVIYLMNMREDPGSGNLTFSFFQAPAQEDVDKQLKEEEELLKKLKA